MHAAQHGAGMAAGAGDQGQRRARLVEAGRIVVEPAQGGIGIERDGRQRLAHLVRNRCGKFTHAVHAAHVLRVRQVGVCF